MLISNLPGLVIGGGSLIVATAAGAALGWGRFGDAAESFPREDYFLMLWTGLLATIDLAWRLHGLRSVTAADPPTVFTREGPVPTKPQPVMKVLNLFLSGETGAQYFWIIPGWAIGALGLMQWFADR